MRKELLDIELIERYLMGKLTTDEQGEFKSRVERDKEFSENVSLQKELVAGLERMSLKADIQEARKTLIRNNWLKKGGATLFIAGVAAMFSWYYSAENNESTEPIKSPQEEVIEGESFQQQTKDSINTVVLTPAVEKSNSQETSAKIERIKPEEKIQERILEQLPQKEFQFFTINPTINNVLTGKEGTVIEIPANAFKTSSTDLVQLKLQEFYKLSDIAFSNLSTQTTSGKILETGGMINIQASQGKNEDLLLEKNIEVKVPYTNKKEGMKLFYGKKVNDSTVNNIEWEQATEANIVPLNSNRVFNSSVGLSQETFTIVEEMPYLPSCAGREKEACTKNEITAIMTKYIKIPDDLEIENGVYKTYVAVYVDTRGNVKFSDLLHKNHPWMEEPVKNALNRVPKLIPGKQRGKAVRVQYTLPISIEINENTKFFSRGEIEASSDSISKQKNAEARKNVDVALAKANDDLGREKNMAVSEEIEYYAFSSSNLGYINCDRFRDYEDKIMFQARNTQDVESMKLIFTSDRSIIYGKKSNSRINFGEVPRGMPAILFALKRVDGELKVAFKEFEVLSNSTELVYEALTEKRLESIQVKLNSINN